jgi:prepilin-type N-terminal cleavage/methylation domain-containing protein
VGSYLYVHYASDLSRAAIVPRLPSQVRPTHYNFTARATFGSGTPEGHVQKNIAPGTTACLESPATAEKHGWSLKAQMNRRKSGFSILELVIVVAIFLIVAAMAIPLFRHTVDTYRLDSSGRVVASKLQDAKMAAVKTNQPYYANVNVAVNPNIVFAAPTAIRAYNPTIDPTATTSGSVVFQAPGGLDHTQLDTRVLGGAPGPFQINATIGFNARGLPCIAGASLFVCNPVGPGGFVWFMQSNTTQGWVAVTVSPTGQIRSWRQVANGNWQ